MKNTNDFKHIIMIITFIFSSMLLLMLLSITAEAQTFKAVDNTVSTDSITITVENVLIDVYISLMELGTLIEYLKKVICINNTLDMLLTTNMKVK